MISKIQLLEYYEKLNTISPNTLFCWFWFDNDEMKGTTHFKFDTKDWKVFTTKNIYRTEIITNNTKELRLDFDNETLEDNLKSAFEVWNILKLNNINNAQIFLTGGKGLHLQFRYFTNMLGGGYDLDTLNEKVYNKLGLNKYKVDKSLFRTNQMIGAEGFKHRKTLRPKQRIVFISNDFKEYKIIDPIDFNYLEDKNVNNISSTLQKIKLSDDEEKKNIKEMPNNNILLTPKNEDILKIERHLKRFQEVFNELPILKTTSGRRFMMTVARYLILNSTNKEMNLKYMEDLKLNLKLKFTDDILSMYEEIIKQMEERKRQNLPNAIFCFKSLLSKEDFFAKKF